LSALTYYCDTGSAVAILRGRICVQRAAFLTDICPEDIKALLPDSLCRAETGYGLGRRIKVGDRFFEINSEYSFTYTFEYGAAVGGRKGTQLAVALIFIPSFLPALVEILLFSAHERLNPSSRGHNWPQRRALNEVEEIPLPVLLAVLQKCLKKGRLKMLFEEWG